MPPLTKILYIEDDLDIQEIVKLTLEQLGNMKICVCDSYASAVSQLKNEPPQLILLDVMMPECDGIDAIKNLKNLPETKDIPVVFVTAKVQKQEVETYLAHGAIGVVKKPFDPTALVATLNDLWDQHNRK